MDGQCNLSFLLGMENEQLQKEERQIYAVLTGKQPINSCIVNAFTASDRVIIPVQADLLSLVGLQQLSETLEAIRTYCNSSLVIDGILVTRYQSRTRLFKDFLNALQQQAEALHTKVYSQTIRESVTVKEAQSMRQSIFEYDARAAVTKDYAQFVDEFMKGASK